MNDRVLVTGGGGFIGSHLVRGLLSEGYRVSVLDNFMTGHRKNLQEVAGDIEAVWESDVRDLQSCLKAVKGVTAVFHLAALASVSGSIEEPILSHEINLTGTLNMLQAARKNSVQGFIFSSSAAVYGDGPAMPKKENMKPDPMSPYALHKLAGEYYCRQYSALFGLKTASLRYFNVFGARQDPESQYAAAVPIFMSAILKDEPVHIYGDGEQTRDFVYVGDVVRANLQALRSEGLNGQVMNIAGGEKVTINGLLKALEAVSGVSAEKVYSDPRPGDIRHSRADISAASAHIGYKPAVGLEDGLRRTFQWFRKARWAGQ
ncbi:UDP-glucose 4-epimerase [bacterium BMS3Abin14]|nr:UDP-glucose 4-epimerase [bacterium BMS3Abin14]